MHLIHIEQSPQYLSLRSCAEVREPIELSFGWWVGSAQALMYQIEVHVAQGKGWIWGLFALFGLMVSVA